MRIYLNTGGYKGVHDGSNAGGDFTDDEVALQAYTIERGSSGLEGLNEAQECARLRTSVLDVVVVDVQLRGSICALGSVECDGGVCSAESVVKDVASPCPVVVAILRSLMTTRS